MKGKIVYIYHSCFLMELEEIQLLFDYPENSHFPKGVEDFVFNNLKSDKPLFVFFSHSHEDHFNKNIEFILNSIKNKFFVLSDDIVDMYGEEIISSSCLVVEPDEEYECRPLHIKTFLSNDLGVAFLIKFKNKNIYFGGDLADWSWPNMGEKAKKESEQFFNEVLKYLSTLTVHVGFSNVDFRLPNFGGGKRFVEIVQPRYFVPTHLFADPLKLDDFLKGLNLKKEVIVFKYEKPGDLLKVDL